MHESTPRKLSIAALCLCLLVADHAVAAITGIGQGNAATPPQARRPERASNRKTSLDWMPDVGDRLRVLELHAARNALANTPPAIDPRPLGRLRPQPPAAGDGDRP
jgi:hypothetical protein